MSFSMTDRLTKKVNHTLDTGNFIHLSSISAEKIAFPPYRFGRTDAVRQGEL